MRILCIEDNDEKYNDIYQHVKAINSSLEIKWSRNGNDGLNQLDTNEFDLIVLDMSLPINSFSKETNMLYGESILEEMKRSRKRVKVLVITGFDQFINKTESLTFWELYERLKRKYSKYLLEMVYYDQLSVEWSNTLKNIIQNIEKIND